jgi:uncharacterized protein (TIGR03437 family)
VTRPSVIALLVSILVAAASGQGPLVSIPSLKRVPIPAPANLSTYVRDQSALVILGKALFWDLQVGSDGKTGCASCHFHAGADHRAQNQLSNALGTFTPNYKLTAADFPFHQLADPANNASRVLRDTTQRAGSAGVPARKFVGVIPGLPLDDGADLPDNVFHAGALNLRQVTGRNTPSAINAVFNFRNFWDGRASNTFTGQTPFGTSDTRSNVLSSASGSLKLEPLRIQNASLASQAVGPPLNGMEMSYDGRSWPNLGKKLLALRPLAYQRIAPDDSVLGAFADRAGRGFSGSTTYLDLVKTAFQPAYWNSSQIVDESGNVQAAAAANSFRQAEFNFSLFFGLAVEAYESTLVSGDTRMDRFADGQLSALSPSEFRGMQLFIGKTGCAACHSGAEFTLASVTGVNGNDPLRSGTDTGFFSIGVRPATEDPGLGALDGLGKPLSTTLPMDPNSLASAVGRFKTPGLRNVEITGPYFHDGGQATLEQVIQFYNRGGDFPPNERNGPNVRPLQLSSTEQADLVAFLKSLTDDRVRFERAPFDHPELCVSQGHPQAAGSGVRPGGNPAFPMSAADQWAGIPPVGRNGNGVPLQTFEELLAGVGADGSRAHNLNDACGIDAVTATGFVNQNAASFSPGILAQNSIVTAKGTSFAAATVIAGGNSTPATLAGLTVNVLDSAGATRSAPLYYVSPSQINYVIPEGTAPGTATVTVTGSAASFLAPVRIAPVSPGVFGVNGLAAANIVTYRNGTPSSMNAVQIDAGGNFVPVAIDLGAEDQLVYLFLYGTGIRNHANPVTATVGAAEITAAYAGAQGEYAGFDQINILLPRSLKGAGLVSVTLTVDGQTTNPVKIRIQ